MAEWSMAVVLKTSRIGYTKTVTFSRPAPFEHAQYVARFWAIFLFFPPTLITDTAHFARNSLSGDACPRVCGRSRHKRADRRSFVA